MLRKKFKVRFGVIKEILIGMDIKIRNQQQATDLFRYLPSTHKKQSKSLKKTLSNSNIRKKISNERKLRWLNPKYKQKMHKIFKALNRTGSKHPRYIDGRSDLRFLIHNLSEYKQWRIEIFERDDFICQICNKRGNKLEAHHKKSFSKLLSEFLKEYNQFSPIEDKETLIRLAMKWKPFWEVDNGMTCCVKCHKTEFTTRPK